MPSKMLKRISSGVLHLQLSAADRGKARLPHYLLTFCLLAAFCPLVGCDNQTSDLVRAKHLNNVLVGSVNPSATQEIEGLGTLTNAGKSLTIRWKTIDRELLDTLRQYTSLTELRILGVDRQEQPLIEHIAALEQLEILSLIEVAVSDDELQMLSALSRLRSLEISQTGIDGSGLRDLQCLPLKQLILHEAAATATGMQSLTMLAELENLELMIPNFHLSELPSFANLPKLEVLGIRNGIYSYREFGGLNCLIGAQSIRRLTLAGVNLNDRSLRAVGQLTNLEQLDIDESKVSFRGIGHLVSLEQLQSLKITGLELAPTSSDRTIQLAKGEGLRP